MKLSSIFSVLVLLQNGEAADVSTRQEMAILSSAQRNLDKLSKINSFIEPHSGRQKVLVKG
jgi:hypothetical protein